MEKVNYDVASSHITKIPGVAGGEASIAGSRIKVRHVYVWYELMDMTPDEIARAYNLTLAQVHAALTYVYENMPEIRAEIQAEDDLVTLLKQQYPSKSG